MTRIEPVDCTVLIVDDHPSFRASARVLLESEGFNVIGEVAVALTISIALHAVALVRTLEFERSGQDWRITSLGS